MTWTLCRNSVWSRGRIGSGRAALTLALVVMLAANVSAQESPAPALDPEVVARAVEEYLSRREQLSAPSPWDKLAESLEVSGDVRLRHESTVKLDETRDRHRERTRLRLGATYKMRPDLTLGARLTTGDPGDPNSANVTLGEGFDSLDVSLDRLYAKYAPSCLPEAWLVAGKFAHPFVTNPVYASVVWDTDVNPEGMAAGYRWEGSGVIRSAGATAGQYLLIEQSASDASMSVAQLSTSLAFCESLGLTAAVGYYHYGSTQPGGDRTLIVENQGNITVDRDANGTPDAYRNRFGVFNGILAMSTRVFDLPATLAGELIGNARTGDRKYGWACGAAIGSTSAPGDWQTYYQWQVIEQEALLSAFAGNDFIFASNYRGHNFGLRVCVAKNVICHASAYSTHRDHLGTSLSTNSESAQWKARFDVEFRF